MKKRIFYTSLLINNILFAQNNYNTNNTQQTIIREIENGEEVEYIIENDFNTKPAISQSKLDVSQKLDAPQTTTHPQWKLKQELQSLPPIGQEEEPEVIVRPHIQPQKGFIQKKRSNKKPNMGHVSGRATILYADDKTNTNSAYYLETGYETPQSHGVSAKISYYVAGDTGLTDIKGKEYKTETGLSETYVKYKGKNLKAKVGQFRLNTPMTKDRSSTISNMYRGAVVSSSKVVKNSTVVGAYITDIDKGGYKPKAIKSTKSRSYSDEELSLLDLEEIDTSADLTSTLATSSVKKKKSDDIAIAGIINKSIKNTTIQAWEYYAFDVANVTYVDGMMKFKMANGVKTMVGAQLIHQSVENQNANPMLIGVKGAVGYKGGQIIVAINKSTGDVILNKWGGDPAYTSSSKSKNSYNKDVTAVKLIGKYNIPAFKNIIPKNLQLIVSQASYSKSSDKKSTRDGSETDIVLKYKPKKNLLFVAAYIDKTSDISDKKNIKLSKVGVKYKF